MLSIGSEPGNPYIEKIWTKCVFKKILFHPSVFDASRYTIIVFLGTITASQQGAAPPVCCIHLYSCARFPI